MIEENEKKNAANASLQGVFGIHASYIVAAIMLPFCPAKFLSCVPLLILSLQERHTLCCRNYNFQD